MLKLDDIPKFTLKRKYCFWEKLNQKVYFGSETVKSEHHY